MKVLEVDGVTHRYASTRGPRPVLDDVSLGLEVKDIVAVVGESGCGKTTLGRLMAGMVPPTEGQVRFDGRDLWSLKGNDLKAYRRAVQVVQQDPYASLNPGLTIEDTLGAPMLHHKMVGRRQLKPALVRILQEVGLDATPAFLARYPHQLSGGQRQRVAIARSMSLEPRVVVADEATSMLDVSMRVAILDLLLSFRQQRDLAYVFISHDLGLVRYFAQGGRIVVMFYGVVVEEGPCEEVINRPKHPYTFLLLEAIPVPDPEVASHRRTEELERYAEGQVASTGCVFYNRCPFAEDACRQSRPPLADVGDGHAAACLFPEKVPTLAESIQGASR
jgi:oligopeptide/dipeptide ABC transporter ATP-binding protein